MKETQTDYWESRARARKTVYKGEEFYTVTEVPLYYRRRQILLDRLVSVLGNYSLAAGAAVLDFGCGDGFYSIYLSKKFDNLRFCGCDLSQQFVEYASGKAGDRLADVVFRRSENTIPFEGTFDVILVILVLAHVPEARLKDIVRQFREKSSKRGKVLLFEQTGPIPREGLTWARRTEHYYESLFTANGFKLLHKELVSFPFFTLASMYVWRCFAMYVALMRRVRLIRSQQLLANRNRRFLIIVWEILLAVSWLFDRFLTAKEGNTFFVFCAE